MKSQLKNCKEMSCKEARKLFDDIVDDFGYDFPFVVDDAKPIGDGSVVSFGNIIRLAYVGVKDIERNDKPIDDYDFMKVLISIFHEQGHIHQIDDIHTSMDRSVKSLAVNYYAMFADDVYYYQNYWNNPREIDAEFSGMYQGYLFCESIFGNNEAERLICMYANKRIRKDGAFIDFKKHKPYVKSDDIFDAMVGAYGSALHKYRNYDIDASKQLKTPAFLYFINHPDDLKIFKKCNDGFEQDKMMAGIYLDKKSYLKQYVPGLQSIDLSLSTVFQSKNIIQRIGNSVKSQRSRTDEVLERFSHIVESDVVQNDDQYE